MRRKQEDDLAVLLHAYRLTMLYTDLLELIALPALVRLADADYEGAAATLVHVRAVTSNEHSPVAVRDTLGNMLFTQVPDDDGECDDTLLQ